MSEAPEEKEGLEVQEQPKVKRYRSSQEAVIWIDFAIEEDDPEFQKMLNSLPDHTRYLQDNLKAALPKYMFIKWRGQPKFSEIDKDG